MKAAIADVLALSPLQEGLFALSRLSEDAVDLYTMQLLVDIDGPVDVELLRRSAAAMLERHPNLRAAFWDRDVPKPVQIIPDRAELPWDERPALPAEFDAIARAERRLPFDLSRGPALRVTVLSVPGTARRRMIFTAHHILMDGWALAVFFTEMLAVYRAGGSADSLPAVRPYRDYIVWLAQQDSVAARARWTAYLSEVSGPLMLADGTAADGVPEQTSLLLPAAETTRLRGWAAGNGLTLNTAVLFAWAVVLSGLAGRRDLVFGTVVSGRPEQLAGVEGMVGLFINTVPVVHHLSGMVSVLDQCARLQRETSQLRDIGYLSLSDIQRSHGHGAMFDSLFVFENAPISDAVRPVTTADGASFRPIEMESLTHYPLTVVAHASGDALTVVVEAIRAALPHLPGADIGDRVLSVLRQLPDIGDRTPDALDIRTTAERAQSVDPTPRPVPRDTVWQAFERQVRATPGATALSAGSGQSYSYAELHAHACRLAGELAARGVVPETVVALVLPRSVRSIVALLAVLAAGGAYLPVDVDLPADRIGSLLGQADPVLAITESASRSLLGEQVPVLVLDDPVVAERISRRAAVAPAVQRHPEHSAYVIFTSGSTGEPKGVIGTNAALLGYYADHRDRVYAPATARLGRPLRIAHAWSLSFDASWQPMVGLLAGHALHLFDAEEMRDADLLVAGIAAHRIDMIDTTPSMYAQLEAAGVAAHRLSVLALGGEAIDATLWRRLREAVPTAVYNCYGPTETTVEAVVAAVAQYPQPTIGTPNAEAVGYVLDSALRMVPTGAVGELYLSGAQLTRGYLGRPGMTAARFVADPFRPGQRMYRTGDVVRRQPHGGYGYLGRGDAQVKIRGYRVEIGEIEAALRARPEVREAAVAVLRRARGSVLVGFVVWRSDAGADPVRLRAALSERLPGYLVPARIVALPRLPMNANGKLDNQELDRLAEEALSASGDVAASTDTERLLTELLTELFNGVRPGADDDFFGLGLDSIVAISLVYKARGRGLAVTPRMVLASPTVRELAAAIDLGVDRQRGAEGTEYGEVLPLPIVSWLFEHGNFRRFTQTVVLVLPPGIDRPGIENMVQLLLDGHDTLRSILADTAAGPRLVTRAPGTVRAAELLTVTPVTASTEAEVESVITSSARAANERIDPACGKMLRAVWLDGDRQLLLLTAHHLAVDVVSWHILLADLAQAWRSVQSGAAPKLLPEFTSYRSWGELMWQRAGTPEVAAQRDHWLAQVRDPDPAVGARHPNPGVDTWSTLRATPVITPPEIIQPMLNMPAGQGGIHEFLLAAVALTFASWRRRRGQDPASGTLIALEGHGRADGVADADTTTTVGWFTSAFPVRLAPGSPVDVERAEQDRWAAPGLLDAVIRQLNAIPNDGLDYGLLRYVSGDPELLRAAEPQIMFNYLGRLDLGAGADQPWSVVTGPMMAALPVDPEPDLPLRFAVSLNAAVRHTPMGAELLTNWLWSTAVFSAADIDELAQLWQRSITVLAAGDRG